MTQQKLLIKNGLIVSSKDIVKKDVYIENGKIVDISSSINIDCDKIIDATNLYIFPGAIDPQVHFREPGATYKEDIESGARAAAAGGVTTFFEMPNTNPSTTSRELLNNKNKIASQKSIVNYSFFLGATETNIEEIKKLKDNCGIKIFMGSSTGTLLVDNDKALEEIFKYASRVVAVHAEDEQTLQEASRTVKTTKFNEHPAARPVEAAVKATTKAIKFALKYKKRLHILHLTTAEEVAIIREHKSTKLITTETTPQHLLLHGPDIYDKIGSFAQMNPPIREKSHQIALWEGLRDGTIDCIATDHSPHSLEEKALPYGQAPSGMPGVETSLALMLNEVSKENITLQEVVKWMCENPANIYKIHNKGFIKKNYDADITIVDMQKEKIILGKNMQSKCGWTAFDNKQTKGWPITTIVNGNIVYENETLFTEHLGKEVSFIE